MTSAMSAMGLALFVALFLATVTLLNNRTAAPGEARLLRGEGAAAQDEVGGLWGAAAEGRRLDDVPLSHQWTGPIATGMEEPARCRGDKFFRQSVTSLAACQSLCETVEGCKYVSYWPDGPKHKCRLTATCNAFKKEKDGLAVEIWERGAGFAPAPTPFMGLDMNAQGMDGFDLGSPFTGGPGELPPVPTPRPTAAVGTGAPAPTPWPTENVEDDVCTAGTGHEQVFGVQAVCDIGKNCQVYRQDQACSGEKFEFGFAPTLLGCYQMCLAYKGELQQSSVAQCEFFEWKHDCGCNAYQTCASSDFVPESGTYVFVMAPTANPATIVDPTSTWDDIPSMDMMEVGIASIGQDLNAEVTSMSGLGSPPVEVAATPPAAHAISDSEASASPVGLFGAALEPTPTPAP